jgi:hypothetical protein
LAQKLKTVGPVQPTSRWKNRAKAWAAELVAHLGWFQPTSPGSCRSWSDGWPGSSVKQNWCPTAPLQNPSPFPPLGRASMRARERKGSRCGGDSVERARRARRANAAALPWICSSVHALPRGSVSRSIRSTVAPLGGSEATQRPQNWRQAVVVGALPEIQQSRIRRWRGRWVPSLDLRVRIWNPFGSSFDFRPIESLSSLS